MRFPGICEHNSWLSFTPKKRLCPQFFSVANQTLNFYSFTFHNSAAYQSWSLYAQQLSQDSAVESDEESDWDDGDYRKLEYLRYSLS